MRFQIESQFMIYVVEVYIIAQMKVSLLHSLNAVREEEKIFF